MKLFEFVRCLRPNQFINIITDDDLSCPGSSIFEGTVENFYGITNDFKNYEICGRAIWTDYEQNVLWAGKAYEELNILVTEKRNTQNSGKIVKDSKKDKTAPEVDNCVNMINGKEVIKDLLNTLTNVETGITIPEEYILSEKDQLIIDELKAKEFVKGYQECCKFVTNYIKEKLQSAKIEEA